MKPSHVALMASLLGGSCVSTAQDYNPNVFIGAWDFNSGVNAGFNIGQTLNERLLKDDSASSAAISTQADVVTSPALTYSVDARRRRANLASFVAKSRASDPLGAAAMEELFASTDILAQLDGELAKQGLSVANVADAYTVWWITVWEAANGVSSPTERAAVDAVKRQAAGALLAVPAFTGASDADKQNLAESLLVQAMLLEAMNDAYCEDATVGPQLRAAAAQGARALGLDLSAMTLTEDGFVGMGADPAIRGSEETAKAAKKVAAAPVGSSPSSGQWPAIHKVVFHMWGDQQFHPTVLFQDGTSYDVGTEALAATSPAEQRREHPDRFGDWTRSGDAYRLTDHRRVADYTLGDGGLFEGFPAPTGGTLSGRYKAVSGTLTGELSMLSTTGIHFLPGQRFEQASSFTASGSGDVSGVSSAGGSASASAGTYRLDGHRIVLTYANGRVVDAFFGFGSEGKPPRPDTDMLFIGDTAYVLDD